MNIKVKINSFYACIKEIGIIATASYIAQRYIAKKDMIVLSVPGIREKIHLRRNSTDVNVFQQIFIKKDLSFLEGKNYKICIDAGANIGLSTIYMKNLFPDATVFSIEPEASNIEMLRLNTKGYTNVTIIDKALSTDSAGLFFVDPGKGSDAFQTVKESADVNGHNKIESIGIRELQEQYQLDYLDFVKIDIEGAEEFIITQDAMPWINRSAMLAIEIHEHFIPGCSKKIKDLLQAGFKISQNGEYTIFENLHFHH